MLLIAGLLTTIKSCNFQAWPSMITNVGHLISSVIIRDITFQGSSGHFLLVDVYFLRISWIPICWRSQHFILSYSRYLFFIICLIILIALGYDVINDKWSEVLYQNSPVEFISYYQALSVTSPKSRILL